jgi:uncharacterized protein (DUF952 family)
MTRTFLLAIGLSLSAACFSDDHLEKGDHPYVFHLIQATLWNTAVENNETYFPPTYQVDGFTHGTSNPDKLLNVANHFYPDVEGDWYCLRMTVESLASTGVKTVFEGTAPVGDTQPDFDGADDELFPHILGGIHPDAVLDVHQVLRDADGTFLSIEGVTTPN